MRNIFTLLFAVVNITCFSQGQILYKTDLNSFPWDGDASTGQIKNRGILPLTIEPYSNTPWSKAPYMYFDGHMRGGQNNPWLSTNYSSDTSDKDNSYVKFTELDITKGPKKIGFRIVLYDFDKVATLEKIVLDIGANKYSCNTLSFYRTYDTTQTDTGFIKTITLKGNQPLCKNQPDCWISKTTNISHVFNNINNTKPYYVIYGLFDYTPDFAPHGYQAVDTTIAADPSVGYIMIDKIIVYGTLKPGVGIEAVDTQNNFVIYNDGHLICSETANFSIIDLTGKVVYTGKVTEDIPLPVELNSNQIYVVKFIDNNGNQYRKKIWVGL